MKLSKYLCAAALIVSVAGCQSTTNAGSAGSAGSSAGASTSSGAAPSTGGPTGIPVPVLPPAQPLKRVAELSYSGGFITGIELRPPAIAVYSDGSVVFNVTKRLTLTPGALAVLVSTLQKDLQGQPDTVLSPKGGHANPDGATTVIGVYQAGGKYQSVYALGLGASSEAQFPAPVADAFAKLEALDSDATTPYITTRVRYELQCPSAGGDPVKPWPAGMPQAGAGKGNNCLELDVVDGAAADAVRAACPSTTAPGQPERSGVVLYRSDKGPRSCAWRYALPDEVSSVS